MCSATGSIVTPGSTHMSLRRELQTQGSNVLSSANFLLCYLSMLLQALLNNQGVVAEHVALAADIARVAGTDNQFKAALHVLRVYGNDASHYSMSNPTPMVQHRCDVLVVVGSMAAYAYDRMLQQLL